MQKTVSFLGEREVTTVPLFGSGVAHSDDLIYLFPADGDLNEEEDATARTMVELWTNFATRG